MSLDESANPALRGLAPRTPSTPSARPRAAPPRRGELSLCCHARFHMSSCVCLGMNMRTCGGPAAWRHTRLLGPNETRCTQLMKPV
jgi:hypothetical protein